VPEALFAGYLFDTIVILLAAVVAVVVSQRLRLGAIIGYLVAGVVIGPGALGLVSASESTRALADLGVVFLLFTVGLELPFERLRVMRGLVFWLGAAQVIMATVLIGIAAMAAGLSLVAAAAVGAALSLSSTAVVIRLISDRGQLTSRMGRTAFAILLVQDLAVAPFLIVVIALGEGEGALWTSLGAAALKMVVAVIALLGIGRIVLRHVFWPVAALRDPEVFAALTLLVVLSTGLVAKMAGLSMAFGAFWRVCCWRRPTTGTRSARLSGRFGVCCWACSSSPWACPSTWGWRSAASRWWSACWWRCWPARRFF